MWCACLLGRDASGDEEIIGFDKKHQNKLGSYTKLGEIVFNVTPSETTDMPSPSTYKTSLLQKKTWTMTFSPHHARYIVLFDCLEKEYHQVRFNTLYMATKVALLSFQHKKKVPIEDVARVGDYGVQHKILQN